jgi:hypothetical protein
MTLGPPLWEGSIERSREVETEHLDPNHQHDLQETDTARVRKVCEFMRRQIIENACLISP